MEAPYFDPLCVLRQLWTIDDLPHRDHTKSAFGSHPAHQNQHLRHGARTQNSLCVVEKGSKRHHKNIAAIFSISCGTGTTATLAENRSEERRRNLKPSAGTSQLCSCMMLNASLRHQDQHPARSLPQRNGNTDNRPTGKAEIRSRALRRSPQPIIVSPRGQGDVRAPHR